MRRKPLGRTAAPVALVTLAAAVGGGACGGSPPAPPAAAESSVDAGPEAAEVTINVLTTGGIAGMRWRVQLDGDDTTIRLVECENACPWTENESRRLQAEDVEAIAAAFRESAIADGEGIDFGQCEGCADQFHHVVHYTDESGTYRIEGDGPAMPHAVEDAVNRLIWQDDPTAMGDRLIE